MSELSLWCCGCERETLPKLVTGQEIYPHRPDLFEKAFYRCPQCLNHVGCHKSGDPLGSIPNQEIRKLRQQIHAALDPIWKSGSMSRSAVYRHISKAIGREYHTGNVNSVQEAEVVLRIIERLMRDHANRGSER